MSRLTLILLIRILSIVNSIFKEFCYQYKPEDVKYFVENFWEAFLNRFKVTVKFINTMRSHIRTGHSPFLRPMIKSPRLCRMIYFFEVETTAFFKDHMGEWMAEFENFMEGRRWSDGLAEEIRAAICDNITLCLERQGEEDEEDLRYRVHWVLILLNRVREGGDV